MIKECGKSIAYCLEERGINSSFLKKSTFLQILGCCRTLSMRDFTCQLFVCISFSKVAGEVEATS